MLVTSQGASVSPSCHRTREDVCGRSVHTREQVSMVKAADVEIGPVSALFVIGEEKMSVTAVTMQGHRYPW